MPVDAGRASQAQAIAGYGRTRYAGLRSQKAAFTQRHVMGDLDMRIEFAASAQRGGVQHAGGHHGIGADKAAIPDYDPGGMGHGLKIGSSRKGPEEPETRASDHRTRLHHALPPDDAMRFDHRVRPDAGASADVGPGGDVCPGTDYYIALQATLHGGRRRDPVSGSGCEGRDALPAFRPGGKQGGQRGMGRTDAEHGNG